jgi:hypothetical protein
MEDGMVGMSETCENKSLQECMPPTLREKLIQKKTEYQRNIEQIEQTIKLMDETPGFEKLHDSISKLRFIGLR